MTPRAWGIWWENPSGGGGSWCRDRSGALMIAYHQGAAAALLDHCRAPGRSVREFGPDGQPLAALPEDTPS